MKNIINHILLLALCFSFAQCSDYLETSNPGNSDDEFVTSTTKETFKTLSWCYANYRQNCFGGYNWNEVFGSDTEIFCEANSSNNNLAIMQPELLSISYAEGPFNKLYTTLARASRVAELIAQKSEFQSALTSGERTDWTQLYGEALTMKALCYFSLVRNFGDVPYGYENEYVSDYSLTSRFDIYDNIIETLKEAAPLMYRLGEGGITAERLSQTYAYAMAGQVALFAGGYQTIRTDVAGLYGNVTFDRKGSEEYNCVYARRSDYLTYYRIAEEYLQKAIDNKGTANLITTDERTYANNPFQRHFQYMQDLKVSPESVFEIGILQGGASGQTMTSEYPYQYGRPSNGGESNSAPCKGFGATRATPTFYYGEFDADDKRRDVSISVTGSKGDGNEIIIPLILKSKAEGGGPTLNKWDENRMNPPYYASQRQSGINIPVMRLADTMLLLAEAKAELGSAGAVDLVNQIRERAFGDASHNLSTSLSGDALKEAVMQERKLELFGESSRRWDLVRSGKLPEIAIEAQNEFKAMIAGLKTNGYYTFANGNVISKDILTKAVKLDNPLTFDCEDPTDPALYPGWRGQYNWKSISAIAEKVKGEEHNVAIKGLFNYINPEGAEATSLKGEGYEVVAWGSGLVEYEDAYLRNILSGIKNVNTPPRYFNPIPFETLSQSKGNITNGYGLAQE